MLKAEDCALVCEESKKMTAILHTINIPSSMRQTSARFSFFVIRSLILLIVDFLLLLYHSFVKKTSLFVCKSKNRCHPHNKSKESHKRTSESPSVRESNRIKPRSKSRSLSPSPSPPSKRRNPSKFIEGGVAFFSVGMLCVCSSCCTRDS